MSVTIDHYLINIVTENERVLITIDGFKDGLIRYFNPAAGCNTCFFNLSNMYNFIQQYNEYKEFGQITITQREFMIQFPIQGKSVTYPLKIKN